MLKALLFDFDGLILDTETPEVRAWQEIYAEYGRDFPLAKWGQIVGGNGASCFDAAAYLQDLLGQRLDVEALRARQARASLALVMQQPLLLGVKELVYEAQRFGLKTAVVSSSSHTWVDDHLSRLGLDECFDAVICAEDVPPGRTKPWPDLFLEALNRLNVEPRAALALEDSPNGVQAARAAGLFVILVPNPVTAAMPTGDADMVLSSLADLSLSDLGGLHRRLSPSSP